MRNFSIFMINSYYGNVYIKKPEALYNLLCQLNNLERSNFEFGYQIYEQISIPFNEKVINNFIKARCQKELLYENIGNVHIICNNNINQKSKITIFKSHIKVQTNDEISFIINLFNEYSNSLFICDFEHKNYFWIGSALKFSVV